MRRLARAAASCVVALALAACSSTTLVNMAYANAALAYSSLGAMLEWQVEDFVDLRGPQEDWVRERVARVLDWHRSEELPRVREFLEGALAHAGAPFGPEVAAGHNRALRERYRRIVEQVVPEMAEFLAGLDAEQVQQLERKFAADNRRFVRESLRGTPAERRERRIARFLVHLEGWIGPVSAAQREMVQAHYAGLADLSDEFMGERRYRQTEILAMLRARADRAQLERGLRRLLVEIDTWRRPEYTEKLRERERRTFEFLAALSATLSAEQRSALQERIRGLLRDIAQLTASR